INGNAADSFQLLTLNFEIMAELNPSNRKSGGRRTSGKMPVRVDLTAMVDLAFLLITFFMLTTSLTKPRVMPVAMPADGRPGPVSETRTMTICLGKNNKVVWYLGLLNKPLIVPTQTGFGRGLATAISETGKRIYRLSGQGMIVVLKPSDHSVYANLVETIDDLNNAQVPTYAIAKISPDDVGLLKQKGIY
ncbi:MAG TPA: biopolymer transporter ExbD, partial [Mucilaginibacter sp.]|nr:biopolymer transporter ExbD [Mucilaginibacter sp.]